MAKRKLARFEDWEAEKMANPDFATAAEELEPGYQIARLRIQRGLTQAQLAEMVGTRQPSIARMESGESLPSLSFLQKVATALDARIEIKLVAESNPEPYETHKPD
jgi:transcriptional regulator with XRE-family HTH domain